MPSKLRHYLSIMMVMLVIFFSNSASQGMGTRSLLAATTTTIELYPSQGSRAGGESVCISGGPFTNSSITITRPAGVGGGTYGITIPIVVMGDRNNLEGAEEVSLLTHAPYPQVNLPGGITVIYRNNQVEVSVIEAGITYQAKYAYILGNPIFIDTKDLVSSSGFYPHEELMNISDDSLTAAAGSQYLYVEAGYARWASIRTDDTGIIDLKTPSYYMIGSVPVAIRNDINDPDSEEYTATFTYTNPVSNPQITNILREGQAISSETINNNLVRPIKVNYKGGNTVTIVGTDFRENVAVKIGDQTAISSTNLDTQISGQISFSVPAADEDQIGRLLTMQVLNPDGGLAFSTEPSPPFYLQYTKGDITPTISKVSPDKGFACGGNQVTIKGTNFRRQGEIIGYTGKLLVSVGGIKVPDANVQFVDEKTLSVKVPSNTAGKKNVLVENPDSEVGVLSGGYTYISMPVISNVLTTSSTTSSSTNKINLSGGQELTIKGSGFMSGAKIVFGAEEPTAIAYNSSSTDFIYLPRNTNLDLAYNRFAYKGGVEWSSVVYVDSQTLKVTVPAGQLNNFGIMVVNPDDGASEIYKDLSYTIEELPVVTNVVAELCNDRSIKIHWDSVAGATYYEVYFQADGDDFEILGTSKTNSIVFEKYSDHTRYRFQVKARNDNAISLSTAYSNEIYANQDGRQDSDGELAEKTNVSRIGSQVMVRIGNEETYSGLLTVDLHDELAGVKDTIITIPAELISSYQAREIQVIGPDFRLKLNPRDFRKQLSASELNGTDSGVRFKMVAAANPVQPGVYILSNSYSLTACAYTGSQQRALEYLGDNIELRLNINPAKVKLVNANNLRPARWQENRDGTKYQWIDASGYMDSMSGKGVFNINRLGTYAIIGDRR